MVFLMKKFLWNNLWGSKMKSSLIMFVAYIKRFMDSSRPCGLGLIDLFPSFYNLALYATL